MQTDSLCHSSCPPRYYPNTKTLACSLCPFDCLTCDSANNCLSCSSNADFRTWNLSTKRCDPSAGYFESGKTVSSQCPSVCSACTSLSFCSACVSGYYLRSDNLCYAFCPLGFFPNQQTRVCSSCPSGCLSCDSSTLCTSCNGGHFMRSNNLCYSSCP